MDAAAKVKNIKISFLFYPFSLHFYTHNILLYNNMSFEQNIQQWIAIDNQMKIINDKHKELRDKKQSLSNQINSYVETKQLSNSTINISDGKLKFINVKDTQQLTFKYLETCLGEIIKNEEQVKKIIEYVKNKREIKSVPEIKRFYAN
jgi:hypothetical protein